MNTQIAHLQHTEKKGYLWRKRYDKNTIEISLQTTLEQKIQQITIQHELEQVAGRSLEEVKKAYFASSTEWHVKTIKDYSACIDRFIVWATASGVSTVEAVSKDSIISFKAYMDAQELAPNTKQKILTRLSGMFKFAVDVEEWIAKNLITGMMYKKVGVVEKKEEVTPAQFLEAFEQNTVQRDYHSKWANAIMFYTGMRVSEVQQLTKNDYIEIEGIKCFSVNTMEEGKSTKTETSIRNIPICDKLLGMRIAA